MSLRQLMIERIFFSVPEEMLQELFQIDPEEIDSLSDLDLFELYESVTIELISSQS